MEFVNELLEQAIQAKTANSHDWQDYAATYNIRLPYTPLAVVLPETAEQVAAAVASAARHGLQVQARCGGHSYTSFSHGGRDGAVVIDLRRLQDVEICYEHGHESLGAIARVGGGVRLGNLALRLFNQGERALAHGTCPSVGIGGHFTHGGYGHCSRAWGLAMDQILGLDVVLADGRLVYADADENADLFYAMRGAADSFGIVVNFYLETQPAPKQVVRWTFEFGDLIDDVGVQGAVSAMLKLQELMQDGAVVDRYLSFGVNLGKRRFGLSGVYLGAHKTFAEKIRPALLQCFPKMPEGGSQCKLLEWLENLESQSGGDPLATGLTYKGHSNFFAKSVTVPEPGLSAAALTSYFQHIESISAPKTHAEKEGDGKEDEEEEVGWFIIIDLYGGADSQINRIPRHGDAAYPHRSSLWVAQHYAFFHENKQFPKSGLVFVEGLNEAMTRHMDGRCAAYINYTDSSLSREQAHALYYGDEVLRRLRAIKRKMDPGNVFAHPQSIL
ncbi:glucooligosaccharide oxidase [Apiospora marii]|uniref:Glucooligosaccharide oxidase n=1 Tax=Apiospora marii TaxID=335849 RepID=A0ABR1R4Z8_9PEZI